MYLKKTPVRFVLINSGKSETGEGNMRKTDVGENGGALIKL